MSLRHYTEEAVLELVDQTADCLDSAFQLVDDAHRPVFQQRRMEHLMRIVGAAFLGTAKRRRCKLNKTWLDQAKHTPPRFFHQSFIFA